MQISSSTQIIRVLKIAHSTRISLEYADQVANPPLSIGCSTQLMIVNSDHGDQLSSQWSTQLATVNSAHDGQSSSRFSTQPTIVSSAHDAYEGRYILWNTIYDLSLRNTAYDPSLRNTAFDLNLQDTAYDPSLRNTAFDLSLRPKQILKHESKKHEPRPTCASSSSTSTVHGPYSKLNHCPA
ncbi:putative LRR receptor-like serine/threonine-protein kinase [Dorcoceras hygrometricum]|uniref:Putative LRR receptor-like serine/threonine-protein kinase n=1 Tax=Dorcoceras hygrometricum TaxID=472368 RepID=A0A2Z7CIP4_9LAMI|nr:putative LRR receptor-like serine/threonine-protein kinase [Dorcoceras hygrometricum]